MEPSWPILENAGGWPLIGIPTDFGIYPWSINSTDFFYEKTHGSIAFFDVKLFFNAVTQSRSRYAIHVSLHACLSCKLHYTVCIL